MTLVSIKNDLAKAREGHYAVPLYDVFDIQGVEGVMDALIEKRASHHPGDIYLFRHATQRSCDGSLHSL